MIWPEKCSPEALRARKQALDDTTSSLHAGFHPNCYLSLTQYAAKFGAVAEPAPVVSDESDSGVAMGNNFDRWNGIKEATDATDEAARPYFREAEVWWVRLGWNIGYETNGKSREFTRPVIVLKKYNQYSFLALPLTTASKPNQPIPPRGWHD